MTKKDTIIGSRKPLTPIVSSWVKRLEYTELEGQLYVRVIWKHTHNEGCSDTCDIKENVGVWQAITTSFFDLMNDENNKDKNEYIWKKLRGKNYVER
jgi:hypothetical protein